MNAERVLAGFARLQADGPEAVVDLLDPMVEMLGPQASQWDCHGRDEVVQFLSHFEPGGTALEITEATDVGDQVLLGTRREYQDGFIQKSYSVVSFRDDRVVLMRGFPTRARALKELAQE